MSDTKVDRPKKRTYVVEDWSIDVHLCVRRPKFEEDGSIIDFDPSVEVDFDAHICAEADVEVREVYNDRASLDQCYEEEEVEDFCDVCDGILPTQPVCVEGKWLCMRCLYKKVRATLSLVSTTA